MSGLFSRNMGVNGNTTHPTALSDLTGVIALVHPCQSIDYTENIAGGNTEGTLHVFQIVPQVQVNVTLGSGQEKVITGDPGNVLDFIAWTVLGGATNFTMNVYAGFPAPAPVSFQTNPVVALAYGFMTAVRVPSGEIGVSITNNGAGALDFGLSAVIRHR